MSTYFTELKRANEWVAAHDKVVVIGQSVEYSGTGLFSTILDIPIEKRIESPVVESLQMGRTIGWALEGYFVVSVFPRFNFMLDCLGQLNHLDKMPLYSPFRPKCLIRTSIASKDQLDPGELHLGDYTETIRSFSKTLDIIRLDNIADIFPAYKKAFERTDGRSTVIIEWATRY